MTHFKQVSVPLRMLSCQDPLGGPLSTYVILDSKQFQAFFLAYLEQYYLSPI